MITERDENIEKAKQAYHGVVDNTRVKDYEDRIAQTSKNHVTWSGNRGTSDCYPTDQEAKRLLRQYGQEYVSYDKTGEPNFSPFAEATVKISDMSSNRSQNFSSAGEKLLGTEWAKENRIETLADLNRYKAENGLTWHECSDGVTMQLVPTKINAMFGHSGGVAEISSMELNLKEDGVIRTGQKMNAVTKIQVKKGTVAVAETMEKIPAQLPEHAIKLGNDFSEGAMDALKLEAAGIPILVEGAMNAVQVVSGEKDVKEAAVDVAKVTSAAAVSGGTMRVVTNTATDLLQNSGNQALQNMVKQNQVAQIVSIAVILKDSFIDYVNGDLDEAGFLNQVNEKAIGLAAGSAASELAVVAVGTGGAAFIPALAAMVVSTACVAVYQSVQNAKQRAELAECEWNKTYHALEKLAQDATIELNQQKELLQMMMQEQYADWEKKFDSGFQKIIYAVQAGDNPSEEIAAGLQDILDVFDKEVAFKTQKEFDDALMDKNFVLEL